MANLSYFPSKLTFTCTLLMPFLIPSFPTSLHSMKHVLPSKTQFLESHILQNAFSNFWAPLAFFQANMLVSLVTLKQGSLPTCLSVSFLAVPL